ncbi:MAG TPA: hypothetical protein VD794_11075 [Flavisolibacter sp.]|nr:hypothetical protein [Flavisolibacter sp.]
MNSRILLSAYSLMIATSLFSCADDKKADTKATATIQSSTPLENTVASTVHPAEQKMYDLSSAFMAKIEAAIAEQDDDKAIALLKNIENEMGPRIAALKPEIEAWVMSLSEPEAKAFGERLFSQPTTEKAYKMMGDPKLNERLQKNAKFREAFENANAGSAKIWQGGSPQVEDNKE